MLASILLLASALVSGGPASRKWPSALAGMVDHATFICIGRVEEVLVVESPETIGEEFSEKLDRLPIARVAVERVLKGAKDTPVVYHEAWGTWTCDDTHAKVGERALFLLGPGVVDRSSKKVQEVVHSAVGSTAVLRSLGSGDGILDIDVSDGEEHVSCVGAPRALQSTLYQQKLADVIAYIELLNQFSLDTVTVHARSGGPGDFDLRIRSDGQARLARTLGRDEQVGTFVLDPHAWQGMHRELDALTAGQKRVVGDPTQHYFSRELSIRTGDSALTFAQPNDWTPASDWTTEQRLAFGDALKAWAIVRAAIDCPECDDHADEDRLWLQAAR